MIPMAIPDLAKAAALIERLDKLLTAIDARTVRLERMLSNVHQRLQNLELLLDEDGGDGSDLE